jgi:hypothetical protein
MPKKRGPKLQTPRKTVSEPRGVVEFAILFGVTLIAYWPALQPKPDSAEAHNNLGNALTHIPGGMAEAVAEFQAALKMEPDVAEIHTNLANALTRTPESWRMPSRNTIAECQTALRIAPDLAPAELLQDLIVH